MIQIAKLTNKKFIQVKVLKYQYKLKIYEIPFIHKFKKRKIELFYQKIEFSFKIKLKTILQLLIKKE